MLYNIFHLTHPNFVGIPIAQFYYASPFITAHCSKYRSMVKSGNNLPRSRLRPYSTEAPSNLPALKSVSSVKSLGTQETDTPPSVKIPKLMKMKIYPIKALQDNYMYLLVDEPTKQAAAVDPANSSAMASAVTDYDVELRCILTTHHHYDHAHGNADMVSMFPDLVVYGGDLRVQSVTKLVTHGEIIKLGNLTIECLATPCHTSGHICYYVHTADPINSATQSIRNVKSVVSHAIHDQPELQNPQSTSVGGGPRIERAVFTGDTLFIAGCGRFFEGSPEQMDQNLNVILGNLPNDTRVYCGHEYTVTNLKFALNVEPQNTEIKSKLEWAQNKILRKEPTVPSTIGEEKRINPFMRLHKPEVRRFTKEQHELEVMSVLRQKKNEFVP